jgi:hypothetical protein
MRFRIKQIKNNIFIPQCKANFFSSWYSIDRTSDIYTWIGENSFSHHSSMEDANNSIKRYKDNLKSKNRYPIYHKVV